jgi:lipoprotein-anchoring transpeptidase ErfK/SrfK
MVERSLGRLDDTDHWGGSGVTKMGMGRRQVLGLAGLGLAEAFLTACGAKGGAQWNATAPPTDGSSPGTSPTPSDGLVRGSGSPVHVRLFENDGGVYGVGMPIIAYLSAKATDAHSFAKATKVKVNGTAADGAWFFQDSAIYPDYPMEAHYRLAEYWPAHADISLDLPVQGLTAGAGLVFDNSLTLDIKTGPKNIVQVDGNTKRMIVTSDGAPVFNFPVSLGKSSNPTFNGVKVVMGKTAQQRMVSTTPGDSYDELVPWSVRVTNSGEFIHAASWNGGNIGVRSTSHGCTNLNEGDAKQYFDFAQVGDVAIYTNTGGAAMPSWDGYGDWNVGWQQWSAGGLLKTNTT